MGHGMSLSALSAAGKTTWKACRVGRCGGQAVSLNDGGSLCVTATDTTGASPKAYLKDALLQGLLRLQ